MQSKNKVIGLTTTVPVEILYSANLTPVDLNNIFITDENPESFIDKAEIYGFPGNSCAWIKGIYSAVSQKNIRDIIAPVWGDCSNTHALCEVLKDIGVNVTEFAFPYDHDIDRLKKEFNTLYDIFGTDENKVSEIKKELDIIRKKLEKLDYLTIQGKISGENNHIWLVNSSDFYGNPSKFSRELDDFLENRENLRNLSDKKRIGIIGVPTIWSDFYSVLEEFDSHAVYNEIQYEFSMIKSIDKDIYSQYMDYTYPYGMEFRLGEIKRQIKERDIQAIIHYTQCFCFRQIEDIILKKNIDIPVLTLEGDKPGKVDARTRMRLENFLDMI